MNIQEKYKSQLSSLNDKYRIHISKNGSLTIVKDISEIDDRMIASNSFQKENILNVQLLKNSEILKMEISLDLIKKEALLDIFENFINCVCLAFQLKGAD